MPRNMKLIISFIFSMWFNLMLLLAIFIVFIFIIESWKTNTFEFVMDCILEVALIALFVYVLVFKWTYIEKIEISNDNIIFITDKDEILIYKMSDIEKVYNANDRGRGFFFKLNDKKKLYVFQNVKFYIEGYDNTHLFKEFFKVE